MKNRFSVILAVMFVFATFGSFAEAQEALGPGRPDPTGRGRYMQFGKEVTYPGATVLTELPEGVNCTTAGEMVGVPVWNTTREGHAIVSVLTPRAEVAIVGKRTFLCYCAGGFNELFLPEAEVSQPPSIVQTTERVIDREDVEDVNVAISNTFPSSERTNYCDKENDCRDKVGPSWGKRILIGVGVATLGYFTYNHFSKKNKGPEAFRYPVPVRCIPTGPGSNCPIP